MNVEFVSYEVDRFRDGLLQVKVNGFPAKFKNFAHRDREQDCWIRGAGEDARMDLINSAILEALCITIKEPKALVEEALMACMNYYVRKESFGGYL